MNTPRAAAVMAVTFGLSGSAVALPTPTPEPPSIQCEIAVVTTPRGTVLRPVARSAADLSGRYQLTVDTSGTGGQSTVSQGGDFVLRAGQSQHLGTISLGHAPRANVAARMDIDWVGGHTGCSRHATL